MASAVHIWSAKRSKASPALAVDKGRKRTVVQEQAGEQETEQHDQAPDEVGDAGVLEDDADEEADRRRRQVKQHDDEDEFEELGPGRHQADHGVDDAAHEDGRDEPQRHNVEDDARGEVGDGRVVPVGALAHEQQSLGREDVEARQRAETEQGQDEEEQPEPVLEPFDVVREPVEEESREDCGLRRSSPSRERSRSVSLSVTHERRNLPDADSRGR